MIKKYNVQKNEEELKKFFVDMKEADNNVDLYLDTIEESGVDLALEIYKFGIAFTRLAVMNSVGVDDFIQTVLAMYERMGGVIEDEDNVTTSHNVH